MDLQLVITILDRSKLKTITQVYEELGFVVVYSAMGHGTAPRSMLDKYGLEATDKAVVSTIVPGDMRSKLFRHAKRQMMIDIPGNGVMLSIPLKCVNGMRTLDYLVSGQNPGKGVPDMKFDYELIIIIMNQGYTDEVMDAARSVGAGGGTVVHAKGTGGKLAAQFLGVSLAEEKEIALIAAATEDKSAIMRAVIEKSGPGTKASAICFSLPITEIAGIRTLDLED